MRLGYRPVSLASLALALASVTCSFPTDKSSSVFVTLESPSRVVLRGQEMEVLARAWQVVGTDTQPINNVDFAFYTTSSSIALVEPSCCGYATVTGVNSGTVDILARAVAFELADQADLTLRVANPLEIDSVRPSVVRHGELLTVYGVGVDSMFLASLGNVDLIEYPFSRTRDPATGTGQITFWVPPPARPAPLFYLGAGVFGFDTALTTVIFEDVYEPNDSQPAVIDLDLGGPWPGTILEPFLFLNPALAFEPLDREITEAQDWFKFLRSDTTRPQTFFIVYPSASDTSGTRTFLLDSLGWAGTYVLRDSFDFIGDQFHRCKTFFFGPATTPRESTIVALRSLPGPSMSMLTFFRREQGYGITVLDGYLTMDSRIGADKFEENDFCHYADFGNRRINLSGSFTDTLTIDNPYDIDWMRIDLTGAGPVTVRFATAARPFAGSGPDTSDIDLYVMTTPNQGTGTGLSLVAADTTAGSTNGLTLSLAAPASYYVAIVDFAGAPTRYSLCMARGIACSLLPSPAVQASPRPLKRKPRASHLGPIVAPVSGDPFKRPASVP